MAATNKHGQPCDKRARLIVRGTGNTRFDWNTAQTLAEQFYGDIGIELLFYNLLMEDHGMSLDVSSANVYCRVGMRSEKQKELYRFFSDEKERKSDIMVLTVDEVFDHRGRSKRGCGSHLIGEPLVILSGKAATKWTLSHEIGHTLLDHSLEQHHSEDDENLMYKNTGKIFINPYINEKQANLMRKSKYLIDV